MDRRDGMGGITRGPARRCAWAPLLVTAAALLAGCSHSPSTPEPSAVVFTPVEGSLNLPFGVARRFSVSDAQGHPLTAVFRRAGAVVTTGPAYDYPADKVGGDSLRADVTTDQGAFDKTWRIWVDGGFGDNPPPVLDLVVAIGPKPGALLVTWNRPSPTLGPRPFLRYWVKIGYDGPLTTATWDAAVLLEEVPSLEGVLGYQRSYAGLRPGAQAWVGVRLEDTGNVLSALLSSQRVRIPGGYRIRGQVVTLDATGADVPLGGLSVSTGDCAECRQLTGPDGSFALPDSALAPEGFRDVDRFTLTIRDEASPPPNVGRFYDFHSDSLGAASPYPCRVVLIPARDASGAPLVSGDCGDAYVDPATGQPEFLDYLEALTFSTAIAKQPLRKWGHYPVSVWIRPAWSDSGGFALGPIAADAVAAWNERLAPEPYFVQAPDSLSADVDVIFRGMPPRVHGLTEIIDPPGATSINYNVPNRILVTVDLNIRYVAYARGVCLHELGHALCLGAHSACSGDIMATGGNSVDPGQPLAGAISDQEALTVRTVRHLAQLLNMRQYLSD